MNGEATARLTDEQLMEWLRQGNTSALDELYRRYAKKLYVFCLNTCCGGIARDAEDLVQDVFLRVIKSAHTFDTEKASFRTWIFSIARNRCIDFNRRNRILSFIPLGKRATGSDCQNEPEEESTFTDPKQDVEESVIRASMLDAVADCINQLGNDEEKQAIVLYYLGGKVYREIGAVLGKSTSMARNRVISAQEQIKRCLERKGIDSASR